MVVLMGKKTHMHSLVRGSVAVLLASYLTGCSSLPSISLPWSETALESNPTAEALLEHGKKDIENKKYVRAIVKFERIRDEFPFSSQTVDAELQIAEARYLNKQYAEAATDFKDFLELHPTNENIPFVIYRLGMVNFDQFTTIDRDQKNIEVAMGYFKTVIKNYANSPYAAQAREKVTKCREYLAEREFYVASFYLKAEKYPAARERLEKILRLYRDTPTAVRALYQLGATFQLEKNSVKASLAYKALVQHYPDSPLVKKARIQLSQLDKEPTDPLAMLLMDGGRPIFTPPPEIGEQKGNKQVARVAKTEVVEEEGGVEKGFFRSIADTINPFSSSEDETDKNKADGKKENGKEEDGFFSSLWPFGTDKKENGKILEQDNGQLVRGVDESLKEKGIHKTQNSPAPNLPQVTLEPPSADPKKVLADIDKGLEKGGKELGDLPPPPEASSKLFVSRPSAPKKKPANDQNGRKTSPTTAGLLDSIDKGLKTKGIEAPKADENARTLGGLEASQPASIPASQPYVEEKVELTPRVGGENTPLFDAGDFQAKGRLEEEEKKVKPTPDKSEDSPEGLPASLVKGPPPLPSEKKPAEKRPADKKFEDEEKGSLDQVTEDLKALSDLLNPLNW
jgi:outer membrane protein assembly factor BamD